MSSEANKAVVRRLFDEVVNRGNLSAADELFTDDFVSHEELPPEVPPGREGVKQLFSMLRSAFPDLHAAIKDELVEGDKVVVRSTFSGTHQGEFMGIPATGRRMQYAVIDILRIRDGKVAEHWGVSDTLSLMQQLGVVPPTPGS